MPLWDLAGEYHILFMTTSWCGACLAEAEELSERTHDFVDTTGIPFSYVILLFQNNYGNPPDPEIAEGYADTIDTWDIPVMADPNVSSVYETPYTGNQLPGKVPAVARHGHPRLHHRPR